jgi:NADH-quinone oxidoreductase subunit A
MIMPEDTVQLWPLLLYMAAVVAMVSGILAISHVLGQRHREKATGIPYESGMMPTGSARLRFSSDLYLVAMFFVIFDLESIFLFAWAVAARELGWLGYAEMALFSSILLGALVYLWRSGALTWGARRQASRTTEAERMAGNDAATR